MHLNINLTAFFHKYINIFSKIIHNISTRKTTDEKNATQTSNQGKLRTNLAADLLFKILIRIVVIFVPLFVKRQENFWYTPFLFFF